MPESTEIESLGAALDSTLASLELPATPRQKELLLAYISLLHRWNGTYNLTAVRQPSQMLVQHLADCLAIVRPCQRARGNGPLRALDVGSGAGLPGLVLAIMLPDWDVTCVDTVGKKAAFTRQAAVELRLPNLRSEHTRVEKLRVAGFDFITARAFASLADLITLTRNQLNPGGVWGAMKGRTPTDEIAALPAGVEVFHVEQLDVPALEAERCIVWMRPLFTQ